MAVRNALARFAAFVFGLLLNGYLTVVAFARHVRWDGWQFKDSSRAGNAVVPTVSKINPNKMMFVSCGGFFE
ncbi:hypothetical protein A3D71_00300 [Candidatus Kaiserbacteria bacterium RIFCSPHIGHO2_02_FULL_55_20]|uniref:Uncharacterized protein n=1 Tax=Candidatus Kaiserbacteria bacterium RIFCSPHIGHO2_02_FULL_55_20 TaxID=1798497 RepID=A0A1F6DW15_9BACT|nr:MAG: hypothetical protein A2680_03220 [Candidatus Kaiserbacteria bacterium RIFCSPHIGHO2_01_FULL_55_37]OGG65527.1 MAG: hypothetical protein A3D71_00300 [Candidatus Kaiserbacteria bacterium RIFCSPHIGHO2_02_FULL_55_20]